LSPKWLLRTAQDLIYENKVWARATGGGREGGERGEGKEEAGGKKDSQGGKRKRKEESKGIRGSRRGFTEISETVSINPKIRHVIWNILKKFEVVLELAEANLEIFGEYLKLTEELEERERKEGGGGASEKRVRRRKEEGGRGLNLSIGSAGRAEEHKNRSPRNSAKKKPLGVENPDFLEFLENFGDKGDWSSKQGEGGEDSESEEEGGRGEGKRRIEIIPALLPLEPPVGFITEKLKAIMEGEEKGEERKEMSKAQKSPGREAAQSGGEQEGQKEPEGGNEEAGQDKQEKPKEEDKEDREKDKEKDKQRDKERDKERERKERRRSRGTTKDLVTSSPKQDRERSRGGSQDPASREDRERPLGGSKDSIPKEKEDRGGAKEPPNPTPRDKEDQGAAKEPAIPTPRDKEDRGVPLTSASASVSPSSSSIGTSVSPTLSTADPRAGYKIKNLHRTDRTYKCAILPKGIFLKLFLNLLYIGLSPLSVWATGCLLDTKDESLVLIEHQMEEFGRTERRAKKGKRYGGGDGGGRGGKQGSGAPGSAPASPFRSSIAPGPHSSPRTGSTGSGSSSSVQTSSVSMDSDHVMPILGDGLDGTPEVRPKSGWLGKQPSPREGGGEGGILDDPDFPEGGDFGEDSGDTYNLEDGGSPPALSLGDPSSTSYSPSGRSVRAAKEFTYTYKRRFENELAITVFDKDPEKRTKWMAVIISQMEAIVSKSTFDWRRFVTNPISMIETPHNPDR
jgi:hypothetical protein